MVAHCLLLVIAVTMGWPVDIADVTSAFLQGLGLPRDEIPYIRAPYGCPPIVLAYLAWRLGSEFCGDMFEATKGIFGLSDKNWSKSWDSRNPKIISMLVFQTCRWSSLRVSHSSCRWCTSHRWSASDEARVGQTTKSLGGCPKLWYPKTALTPRFREPFAPQQNRDVGLWSGFRLFISL